MAIQKLEDNTVRLLGASQVLSDPSALVKELIDNALDAKATSIAIGISANTLDVIQVRDNGHGIAPEDRAMAARPNCTSKLADFDDLRTIGGTTLGFRGQALAAAAELSGGMIISTRVEGEEVASAMTINQLGEVVSQQRTSLPVGTTVRIADFVKSQPVRRQQALKNAEKTLKHVKQTLQAYAFARPHVRFSLRVLKAKNDKGNWMYAPKPGAGAEDAAIKIVGSACVSQCEWIALAEAGYEFRALVPRPDAEVSKVVNAGSFVSVDGRPVSIIRGTMKQAVKIFREALKGTGPRWSGAKDPFINLLISCPAASYDPNVEPSKDDVLFEDPDAVIASARKLFSSLYAITDPVAIGTDTPATGRLTPRESAAQRAGPAVQESFIMSLEKPWPDLDEPTFPEPPRYPTLETTMSDYATSVPPRRAFRRNMYGCDEEDVDLMDARPPTGRTEAEHEELRQARKDITVSNPWVTAKMNATRKQNIDRDEPMRDDSRTNNSSLSLPVGATSSPQAPLSEHVSRHGLPTPRPSSPSPSATHANNPGLDIEMPSGGGAGLPVQLRHVQDGYSGQDTILRSAGAELNLSEQSDDHQTPAHNHGLATGMPTPEQGTPLHAIPYPKRRPRQSPNKQYPSSSPTKRPFVTPITEHTPREKVWFDHLEDSGPSHQKGARRRVPRDDAGLVRQGELGDLLDEPRPLTPPRRNQDIRAWVGSVDRANEEVTSVVERRNYGHLQRAPSASQSDEPLRSESAALKPVYRGFVPASDLAILEAHAEQMDQTAETAALRPKRQKSGGARSRALRELSTNVPVEIGQHTNCNMLAVEDTEQDVEMAVTKRRRTTEGTNSKVQRTKSARLPLERIPRGQAMHNLETRPSVSVRQVSCWAGMLDEDASLSGWNETAMDMQSTFAAIVDVPAVLELSQKLRGLLVERVSDGEMVQDLEELVATATRNHGAEGFPSSAL